MKFCYIKCTIAELPEDLRVSINSSPQVKATPELTAEYLNKLAKQRKLGAVYEAATREEYDRHWAKVRAANAEAQARREGTASVLQG